MEKGRGSEKKSLFGLVRTLESLGLGSLEVRLLSAGVYWYLAEAWTLAPTKEGVPRELEILLQKHFTPILPRWLQPWDLGRHSLWGGEVWLRLDLHRKRVHLRATAYTDEVFWRIALFPWEALGETSPPRGLFACREADGWHLLGSNALQSRSFLERVEAWLVKRGIPVSPRMEGGLEVGICVACKREGLEVIERRLGPQPLATETRVLPLEGLLLGELAEVLSGEG